MVKEQSPFSLFHYFRSFSKLPKETNFQSTLLLFIGVIVCIAIIATIYSYLDYANTISSFLQILLGMPILWLIFYGIYYIFQNAFESKTKIPFWKSYLQIGIPVLTGVLIMHLVNLLQYISSNMYIIYLFALINSILGIYILVMFIGNMKSYYNTTYPKILASILLVFLTNICLVGIFTLLTI